MGYIPLVLPHCRNEGSIPFTRSLPLNFPLNQTFMSVSSFSQCNHFVTPLMNTRPLIPHEDGKSFLVPLTRGFFARIDAEDVELVSRYNWNASKAGGKRPYACATNGWGEYESRVAMHRLVTNCPDGMVPDHINFDTLDNRKENLRICTQSDNSKRKQKKTREQREAEVANQEQRQRIGLRAARKALATLGRPDELLAFELAVQIAAELIGYVPLSPTPPKEVA